MSGIRVVVNMHVRPEAADAFARAWAPICHQCRAEPGNRQYELFASVEFPEQYALLELWDDQESYDAHWANELQRHNPAFDLLASGERRAGEDGVEFHFDHRYYRLVDGRWEPDEAVPRATP